MTFKDTHTLEGYIKHLNVSKFVYALARIRIGATDLNVNNTDCPFCGTIEDELHLIRDCHIYGHLRAKYLNPHYNHDNITDLKPYFYPKDIEALKALAQYIHYALKTRREEITYNNSRLLYTIRLGQTDTATQTDD